MAPAKQDFAAMDASPGTKGPAIPQPANASAPGAGRPSRADQEFLPAALEILETPPSPIGMGLIIFMAVFVVVALLWTYWGRLDVIAIAQGKIQPPGRVKIVQPVEMGKVLRILATNSARVAEGDLLVEFDPSEARADVEALEAATFALEAEIMRRGVAIEHARQTGVRMPEQAVSWRDHIPSAIRLRETSVLSADLAQLDALVASIDSQIALKDRELQRLTEMITAQSSLIGTLQERVTMRSTLVTSGSGSRASVIDGKETLQKEETVIAGQRGQLRETEASIRVLATEREKQLQGFLTENTQKKAEAGRQLEDISQRLVKARNRLKNMTLRSPAEGIVQASSVFTIGQVVTAGQEIMRVVPGGVTLEVEAYLPNKDIGFVRPGQEVIVKVESFPFTRYGTLTGRVTQIARDAIPLPDAAQIEGNPARSSESATFAGAQRTQNLVFPITIALEKPELTVDGRAITMSPGMAVTAEVKTGSRRILEYLFSPLIEVGSEAMRER